MTPKQQRLFVFANLDAKWVPCGQLDLTEDAATLLASSFAYGLKYLERRNALEVDPVSLSIHDKSAVQGKALFPSNNLSMFGGIRGSG
jgi:serine/threonine-protein kinase HipA